MVLADFKLFNSSFGLDFTLLYSFSQLIGGLQDKRLSSPMCKNVSIDLKVWEMNSTGYFGIVYYIWVHSEPLHAFVVPRLVYMYVATFSSKSRNFDLESWKNYFQNISRM